MPPDGTPQADPSDSGMKDPGPPASGESLGAHHGRIVLDFITQIEGKVLDHADRAAIVAAPVSHVLPTLG